jgi:hypothetical protein
MYKLEKINTYYPMSFEHTDNKKTKQIICGVSYMRATPMEYRIKTIRAALGAAENQDIIKSEWIPQVQFDFEELDWGYYAGRPFLFMHSERTFTEIELLNIKKIIQSLGYECID